jgi:hypothetical protein
MVQHKTILAAAAATLVLAACGGSGGDAGTAPVTPPSQQATRVDVLSTSARGIESIAFKDSAAYMSVSNSAASASGVLKTALPLKADGSWTEMAPGACGMAKASDAAPTRAATVRLLGTTLWLFQPWYDSGTAAAAGEHSLCALDASASTFVPRDQALKVCYGSSCSPLWMTELKQNGKVLYTNAGAGTNVFASSDGGAKWQVLLGQFDSMMCTHSTFQVVGDRLLVGGECPLDFAFLRAYQLRADGQGLASPDPLPLTLPNLENRNVQFISQIGVSPRVFAGVEGGLLRSEDGGRNFKFVIEEALSGGKNYPYIRSLLSLSFKPDTIVVGGFDKATQKPYLAWSADGGSKWADISSLLPGYNRAAGSTATAQVTSVSEDPQGHIIVTVNEDEHAKGSVLLLTLGK